MLWTVVVEVVAYAFRSHNWSVRQRHHRLQSAVWTSHRVVLSVGRIWQYVTSFGSHRRNTGRSLWVSISSYKNRSDLVRCGSGSRETTVVEGEQNPAVRLWGHPQGGHWPPKPTSRILSTDCWCQLLRQYYGWTLSCHRFTHSSFQWDSFPMVALVLSGSALARPSALTATLPFSFLDFRSLTGIPPFLPPSKLGGWSPPLWFFSPPLPPDEAVRGWWLSVDW